MFAATRYHGRHPHFSRESLSASLAEESIQYHWLESLGGNRKPAKDAPPSLNRGIEDEASATTPTTWHQMSSVRE